jgi:hypothetical protein
MADDSAFAWATNIWEPPKVDSPFGCGWRKIVDDGGTSDRTIEKGTRGLLISETDG